VNTVQRQRSLEQDRRLPDPACCREPLQIEHSQGHAPPWRRLETPIQCRFARFRCGIAPLPTWPVAP